MKYGFGNFLTGLATAPKNPVLACIWLLCVGMLALFASSGAQLFGNSNDMTYLERRGLQLGVVSTATANPILSTMAAKFMQDSSVFVGMTLAPLFPTGERSANYYVMPKGNAVDVPKLLPMAPGAPYKRSILTLGDDTYYCKKYGEEAVSADENVKRYGKRINLDRAEVLRVLNHIRINHEVRVRDLATGNTVDNSSPSTKWDQSNSTPLDDIKTAREVVRTAVGKTPNLLILPQSVFVVLEDHSDFTAKIAANPAGIYVTPEVIARATGIQRVAIAGGLMNTANPGQAASVADIWGDSVILAHVDPSLDLEALNFLRTFAWTGGDSPQDSAGPDGIAVRTYRDDSVDANIHKVNHFTDEKAVATQAGYHLSNVLAG